MRACVFVSVCVCVCICVYMHVCMRVYMNDFLHLWVHIKVWNLDFHEKNDLVLDCKIRQKFPAYPTHEPGVS